MSKFLLLDSNGPILTMPRERKGHKSLFLFGYSRCVEILHRSLVALRLRLIHLSYSQEKPGKAWIGKKKARVAELFFLFTMFLRHVIYIEKKPKLQKEKKEFIKILIV